MVVEGNGGIVGVTKLEVGDISTVNLELNLVINTIGSTKDIYAVNYNVLRIENGMGGLLYSN